MPPRGEIKSRKMATGKICCVILQLSKCNVATIHNKVVFTEKHIGTPILCHPSLVRVFVPTSFFQLLLELILFPMENCLVKRKKVRNVSKLSPPHYFKHRGS